MFNKIIGDTDIVIFDLEWNQGTYYSNYRMPHEIIEIGACRIDRKGKIESRFSRIVKPVIYKKMDRHIQKVTGITQMELEQGTDFLNAWDAFVEWCGDSKPMTWGRDDYPVLKRNVEFYHRKMQLGPPLDAQLLFGFAFYNDANRQFNLHSALETMEIVSEIPAHRAVYDAEATSLLLPYIDQKLEEMTPEQEQRLQGIIEKERRIAMSRIIMFPTRYVYYSDVIKDSRIMRVSCPVCNARTSFTVPWFDSGKEKYESICHCKSHGNLMGTMHFKKNNRGQVVVSQRITLAVDEQVTSVKNKYHAFKLIPENKRHHRLEMSIGNNAQKKQDKK